MPTTLKSLTTTDGERMAPLHPGEILFEEFMKPLGLSQCALARGLSVPPRRINQIVHAQRAVSMDTALRLARYLGTSVELWLGLQTDYELDIAEAGLRARVEAEVRPLSHTG